MTAPAHGFPPSGRILLAVDPGARRTGLASVGTAGIVTTIGIIESDKLEACGERIVEEITRLGAELCIIGLPVDVNGVETGGCRRSRILGRFLEERGFRVQYQSEFLTTSEARRRARELGRAPSRPVDDLAAAILLEDLLAESNIGGNEDD